MQIFPSSVLIGLIVCSAGILMVLSINLAVSPAQIPYLKKYPQPHSLNPATLTAWQECRGSQTHSSKNRMLHSEDTVHCRGDRRKRGTMLCLASSHSLFLYLSTLFFSDSLFFFTEPVFLSLLKYKTSVPHHIPKHKGYRVLLFTHPYLHLLHKMII